MQQWRREIFELTCSEMSQSWLRPISMIGLSSAMGDPPSMGTRLAAINGSGIL
jgi:hypothetical protein